MLKTIKEKIAAGQRFTDTEANYLFELSLPVLGELASQVKQRFHPKPIATFVTDININLTNVCECECDFCAFYVNPGDERAFTLTTHDVFEKLDALVELGSTQVLLQGGLNPELGLNYYLELLAAIKQHYPQLYIHSFSPPEIAYIAAREQLPTLTILGKMRAAGLNSLPGGGAEILVNRVRQTISPKKISRDTWLGIMREAHQIGMQTTATMMFAGIETTEERIEHLSVLRQLQDETGGFRAFIPWTFSPNNTRLSDNIMAGGGEYLKTLAISRIYLDNITHIGSGWVTEGMKVAQLGLLHGADDMGGILMEEKVLESTGMKNSTNIAELIKTISDAGLTPARRNTEYEIIEEYPTVKTEQVK
ncbi:MAG: dehypoxanthine futalosine cyclase [Victivallaceae bacterium]|nr:dehypoxanthine futalosine cyclase [Victivallaceae bacterium]